MNEKDFKPIRKIEPTKAVVEEPEKLYPIIALKKNGIVNKYNTNQKLDFVLKPDKGLEAFKQQEILAGKDKYIDVFLGIKKLVPIPLSILFCQKKQEHNYFGISMLTKREQSRFVDNKKNIFRSWSYAGSFQENLDLLGAPFQIIEGTTQDIIYTDIEDKIESSSFVILELYLPKFIKTTDNTFQLSQELLSCYINLNLKYVKSSFIIEQIKMNHLIPILENYNQSIINLASKILGGSTNNKVISIVGSTNMGHVAFLESNCTLNGDKNFLDNFGKVLNKDIFECRSIILNETVNLLNTKFTQHNKFTNQDILSVIISAYRKIKERITI